jgi:signal transduction histidine kinase
MTTSNRTRRAAGRQAVAAWQPQQVRLDEPAYPGLRAKLLIFYVVMTIAVALAVVYISTRLVAASAGERFSNRLQEASRVAGDGVARLERSHLEQLRLMAQTAGVAESIANRDAQALQTLLAPLAIEANTQVVAALDPGGLDIVTLFQQPGTGELAASSGADYSQLEPVRQVLTGRTDSLGDKYAGLAAFPSGAYVLTTAPVRGAGGAIAGALLIGTRLDTLLALLKAQTLADVLLLNPNGNLIATTLPEADEGYAGLELVGQVPAPEAVEIRDLALYGRDYRALYAPLMLRREPAGVLGVVLSLDYVTTAVTTGRNTILFWAVLGTLLFIVVGYSLGQSIVQPVRRLRDMARAVAAGDLGQRSGLRGGDELAELGRALDDVVTRLREREIEVARLLGEMGQRNQALVESHAALQLSQQQLAQLQRLASIGELAAGVVHDIRNPLSIIIGTADVFLEEEQASSSARRDLMVIRESAVKANRLVSDLLKLARQAPMDVRRHDLRLTIASTLQLTGYLAREARVAFKLNLPEEPVWVDYDANQIEQVLINLVRNGIQAMPQGGNLIIQLRVEPEAAVISVQDTGQGITPEHLAHIFEPFFTTRPAGQGTGLGLSVSAAIVEAHHGRLDVASHPGQGSVFSLWLPLPQSSAEMEALEPVEVSLDQ